MRTAVLISGRGSNLQALIEAAQQKDYPARLCLVISNVAGAGGLARAEAAAIPTATLPHQAFASKAAFEDAVTTKLVESGCELVCLAGFMRVLSGAFVARWQGRLLNIHPSLLPAFPGLDTHARALAAGVTEAGCSVHFVSAVVDGGELIGQQQVPVLPNDTPETLGARVLAAEHQLYPRCLAEVARRLRAKT